MRPETKSDKNHLSKSSAVFLLSKQPPPHPPPIPPRTRSSQSNRTFFPLPNSRARFAFFHVKERPSFSDQEQKTDHFSPFRGWRNLPRPPNLPSSQSAIQITTNKQFSFLSQTYERALLPTITFRVPLPRNVAPPFFLTPFFRRNVASFWKNESP